MVDFDTKFQSKRQDWETPDSLYDQLHQEFNFNFDLAASLNNSKCDKFYTQDDNALNQKWVGRCWCNPPYGGAKENKLANWVSKGDAETKNSESIVVMLIPARTNTKWWHKYCMTATEIKLLCGRPKFSNSKHGLPQPLAVVVFSKHSEPTKISSLYIS